MMKKFIIIITAVNLLGMSPSEWERKATSAFNRAQDNCTGCRISKIEKITIVRKHENNHRERREFTNIHVALDFVKQYYNDACGLTVITTPERGDVGFGSFDDCN